MISRGLAALLLAVAVAACESPEEKAAEHLAHGIELYEEGSDVKALLEFRNVLRIEPKNSVALFHVGLIHERAERLPQAYGAYEAAVAEKPDYVEAQVRLGTLALFGEALDVAQRAADALERVAPEDPDGLALRGAVMLRRGDLEQAFETAGEALAQDPAHENAAAVQVGVLMAQRRPEDALTYVDEAIARLPQSSSLLLLKIAVLEQQGDAIGVMRTFQKVLELEPKNAKYRFALADYLQQQGDLGAAETVLRTALDQGLNETETIAAIVSLVSRQRGFEAAEAELRRLIAAAPQDYGRQLLLAELYLENDESEAAEPVLQAIVAAMPQSDTAADARVRLAQIRLDGGDDAGAAALADTVLARSGEHRAAHLVKGVIALRAGDADEVIRRARAALREEPTWPPGRWLLADGYLLKGDRDLAIDALDPLVTADAADPRTASVLARLLSERGDLDAALKLWNRVLQSTADPAPALRARAAIAIRQGQWATAEADIRRLGESAGQDADAALLAGNLRLAQARFDEGREWFLEAERLRPEASDPAIGVVHAYLGKDDVQGALAYLKQRLEQRPADAVAYEITGELLARKGASREAEAAFREATRLQPDWLVPYRQLGALLLGSGASERAAEVYEAAIATAPTDASLYLDLGSAHLAGGRIDAAMAAFERALAVDPENEVAANNWAALVGDHHYRDEAKLARALELAEPFRAGENPFFLDTLGWLHYRKGDYPVALSFIERAGTSGGSGPQFHYHRGMTLQRLGELERAAADLAKAVADDVNYTGRDEARATLQALQGRLARSEQAG